MVFFNSCNTDAKLNILMDVSPTLSYNKHPICSIGSLGLGLLWGHVVPVCEYFFPTFGIFEPWHHILLKAADCSLHRVMEGNHTRAGITL